MLTNEFLSIAQMTIPETFEECLTYEMQILYLKRYIDEIAEGGIPSADLTDIWDAIHALEDEVEKINPDKIEQEIHAINEAIQSLKDDKQDTLTFDTTPTLGSQNPVTSDGIRKAIDAGGGGGGGSTVSVDVGETVTGEPGTNAEVENTGDEQNVVLKFTIPRGEKGEKGEQGDPGEPGERGPEGPQGAEGPEGPQGEQGPAGERGPEGPQGDPGESATITVGETVTGEPGTPAKVENTGTAQNAILKFTIPKGEKGDPGTGGGGGNTVSVDVGETVTGEPGTNAEVENTGDEQNVVLKFTIPRGETGAKGDPGEPGERGPAGERGPQGDIGPEGPQGPKGDPGEQGPAGENGAPGAKGDPGESATVTVGETVTGEPGTDAKVENVGTAQNAVLKFTIPKGEKGDPGEGGGGGTASLPYVSIKSQTFETNHEIGPEKGALARFQFMDSTGQNYTTFLKRVNEAKIRYSKEYLGVTKPDGYIPINLPIELDVVDDVGTSGTGNTLHISATVSGSLFYGGGGNRITCNSVHGVGYVNDNETQLAFMDMEGLIITGLSITDA